MPTQDPSRVAFTGSVPHSYQDLLVPIKFLEYASDLAARTARHVGPGAAVLETAAGTGVVTRELRRQLPSETRIVATDLNPDMLAVAAKQVAAEHTEFTPADATALPFENGTFDAVVCQFGVMFFPDESLGYAEARRVLRPGGLFCFNVWDQFEFNPLMACVQACLEKLHPTDPPMFFHTPFRVFDATGMVRALQRAGFGEVRMAVLTKPCRLPSARAGAEALVNATPLGGQVAKRGMHGAADAIAIAFADAFSEGDVDRAIEVPMQAVVFEAEAV